MPLLQSCRLGYVGLGDSPFAHRAVGCQTSSSVHLPTSSRFTGPRKSRSALTCTVLAGASTLAACQRRHSLALAKKGRRSAVLVFEQLQVDAQPQPPMPMQSPDRGPDPATAGLGDLFDMLGQGNSSIGMDELKMAIDYLNADYQFDFQPEDAPRLFSLLLKTNATPAGSDRISRSQFIAGVSRLVCALTHIRATGLTLNKMKVVLASVFDRFDSDNDGSISEKEFMTGLEVFGLRMEQEDARCLHCFFTPDGNIRLEHITRELPVEEKLGSAVRGMLDVLQDRFKWGTIRGLIRRFRQAQAKGANGPWAPVDGILGTAWMQAEDACAVAEAAVEVASLIVGTQCLLQAGETGLADGMDLEAVAPFVLLIAALLVKINKDLSELVPKGMSEDEALLYWGVFQKQGFSQASFARLLACKGCRWVEAESGEVLSNMEASSLRIVVKGPVAVEDTRAGTTGELLPPGMLIGETSFLGGTELWDDKAIVAQDRVTYVHWDFDSLRECLHFDPKASYNMNCLLCESMVTSCRLAASLRGMQVDSLEGGLATPVSNARRKSFDDVFHHLDEDKDGRISRDELHGCWDSCNLVFERLGFERSPAEFERLFAYLDGDDDGVVSRAEFTSRLRIIEEWSRSLAARRMTMGDLGCVLARATDGIDADGDGFISCSEFWAVVQSLDLQLTKRQSDALHAYLDRDGDGLLDVQEWKTSRSQVHAIAAFRDIITNHAEKKGLKRFTYFSRQIQLILEGPKEPAAKLRACLDMAWDGIESVGDVASWGLDVLGYLVAFTGIWRELSGVATPEDIQDMDLAPFLLFLGMSSVEMLRKDAESSISDLALQEALLYTKAFESTDVSIVDFQKMLKQVEPRWETYSQGEVVASADQRCDELLVVTGGGCNLFENRDGLSTWVGSGGFLTGSELASKAWGSATIVATEQTEVASLPMEQLRPYLECNDEMRMKVQRAIIASMSQSLLGVHPAS